jgi:uncharacterized membrane protein YeiH
VESTPIARILDLLGVAVFAVSGALAAGRKQLDLLGVMVIAVVTAIGGGTTRDLLMNRPIFWMNDPAYLVVILLTSLATIAWASRRRPPRATLQIADAFGLALFVISGARIAEAQSFRPIIVVLMGTITGVAGGVVRDVLTNEIPMVLRRGNLYASAAIAGATAYLALEAIGVARGIAALLGMSIVAALRIAAILFGLRLPVFQIPDDPDAPTG